MLALDLDEQGVAGADGVRLHAGPEGRVVPAEELAGAGEFALGDVDGQARDERGDRARDEGAAFEQVQRRDRGGRLHVDADAAPAGGVKPGALEAHRHARAQAVEQGGEDPLEEVEAGGERVVRAALEHERAGAGAREQGGQHGLQDERGAAGGADGEVVLARLDALRGEGDLGRTERVARDLGAPELRRRAQGRQVLAHQTRALAAGANAAHAQGLAREQREAESGAQDLPPALADRTVDSKHGALAVYARGRFNL